MSAHEPLDEVVTFGKYRGATWRMVLQRDPRYVRWACANVERMNDDLRTALDEHLIEGARNMEDQYDPFPFADEWE